MEASRILIEKIKEFEGLRLSPYRCAGGVWKYYKLLKNNCVNIIYYQRFLYICNTKLCG